MRVFVAGATGILGRRVVRSLVAAGHAVVGASRSAANQGKLADLGAEARECDLFSAASVKTAVAGCDAVLHLATAIPPAGKGKRVDEWAQNDRLRREGTANLLAAAAAHRCQVYVQESVAFVYGDCKGAWVDEDTPIAARQAAIIQSSVDMEKQILASTIPARILRFGSFYAAESDQTQMFVDTVRTRRFRSFGAIYWSPIHVDDAASAVVAATTPVKGAEIYNIVDDEPVLVTDLVAHLASVLGVRPPGKVPAFLARLVIGKAGFPVISASARVKNRKARDRLDWKPKYSTFRSGYAQVVKEMLAGAGAGGGAGTGA
jgi:nucleoside-diphosphate-sugar epimerase